MKQQQNMMICRLSGRRLLGSALAGLMMTGFSLQAVGEEKKEDAWEAYQKAEKEYAKRKKELAADYVEKRSTLTDMERELNPGQAITGMRVLQPKVRIFFDTGTDDPGEVDIFSDGELGLALEFIELYWQKPTSWNPEIYYGASLAAGIGSSSGTDSSAVFIGSAALYLGTDLQFDSGSVPIGIECGVMYGLSADEDLEGGDRDDTALFIGVKVGGAAVDTGKK